MKRLFLLFTLVLTISNLNAQKLRVDKIESNGSRLLISQTYELYRSMMYGDYVEYHLGCSANKGVKLFMLYFYVSASDVKTIREGDKLLIKLNNDSIIELSNQPLVRPYEASYYLSEEQVKELINNDVVKIRIEHSLGFIDRDIKKNKFSKRIKESYDLIEEALQKDKDIRTGF